MMPELSPGEAQRLAELSWEFCDDLDTGRSPPLSDYLARWPDEATRSRLAAELARCEAGQLGFSTERLAGRLVECGALLSQPAWKIWLLQGIYSDAAEVGVALPLDEFLKFGFSAQELRLAGPRDPVFLGEVVGERFVLERRLGAGNFGVVYSARDGDGKRRVAIKFPRGKDNKRIERSRELLVAEADLLRDLAIAGVPKLLGLVTTAEGVPGLVMELVEGATLENVARDGPLDWQAATLLLRRLAEVMVAVHERRLLHCDLKPENVIVDQSGQPFVTDFGLALADKGEAIPDGRVAGTPDHMAPESLVGLSSQLDPRADLWSLGVIYYRLLTGKRLNDGFEKEDCLVIAVGLGKSELDFSSNVPASVRKTCERCLALEPYLRFDCCQDLVEALDAALNQREPQWITRLQLVAWRMGMKLGGAVENHGIARRKLKEATEGLTANQWPTAAFNSLREALGFELGMLLAFDDLTTLAGSIHLEVGREPAWDRYQRWFYQPSTVSVADAQAWAVEATTIGRRLESLYGQLGNALREHNQTAVALFVFATHAVLWQLSRESPDELLQAANDTKLPRHVWEPGLACFQPDAKAEAVRSGLRQLDKDVERWLIEHADVPAE